jgi:hypothetical protein
MAFLNPLSFYPLRTEKMHPTGVILRHGRAILRLQIFLNPTESRISLGR